MSSVKWKDEINDLLADVEQRIILSLNNIQQSSLLFNEEFQTYFCRTLCDRVANTYTMYKIEHQLQADPKPNHTNNTIQTGFESKPNITDLLTMDYRADEELDDSESNTDSKNDANQSDEEDNVQQECHGEADDMEATDCSMLDSGDENTSEFETPNETNWNDNRELELSSEESDGKPSVRRRVSTSPNKGFICPIKGCFSTLRHKRNLKEHIKSLHGFKHPSGKFGIVRFACKLCEHISLHKSHFTRHFKNKHSDYPKDVSKNYYTEKFTKMPPLK